jgi:IS4 transposase
MTSNNQCVDIKITHNRMQHIEDKKLKKELLEMEQLRLRVTKLELENGEEEHLISNFYFDEVDYEEIKDLYIQRWEIEKCFNVLKNKLELENTTGQSPIAIEQDFNSQILVYNIIQDVKNEAEKSKWLKKTKISTKSEY